MTNCYFIQKKIKKIDALRYFFKPKIFFAISQFFAIFRNLEKLFASRKPKIFSLRNFSRKKFRFRFASQFYFERYLEPCQGCTFWQKIDCESEIFLRVTMRSEFAHGWLATGWEIFMVHFKLKYCRKTLRGQTKQQDSLSQMGVCEIIDFKLFQNCAN